MARFWRLVQAAEFFPARSIVVEQYVPVAFGSVAQKVCFGEVVVVLAHFGKVAVGVPYGGGVFEVECRHKPEPCHGVEQAAAQQYVATAAVRQIFVEHQQIVAEIKVCLARIFGRQRTSAQMIDLGLRHGGNAEPCELYAPA